MLCWLPLMSHTDSLLSPLLVTNNNYYHQYAAPS